MRDIGLLIDAFIVLWLVWVILYYIYRFFSWMNRTEIHWPFRSRHL